MSARYETPLLVDLKIQELKIWGEKYKICTVLKTQTLNAP